MHYKRIFEYLKNMMGKAGKKKVIENSVIIIIIGVIIIIAASSMFKDNTPKDKETAAISSETETAAKVLNTEEKNDLEEKMESILSKIDGAGKVEVLITYKSGKEIVPAYETKKNQNDTQEKDTSGGTRSIKQEDYENRVIYEEGQNGKKPVIAKEMLPAVKGVVVVADGAQEVQVKENLVKAVEALVDVPPHKIQVFQRNK